MILDRPQEFPGSALERLENFRTHHFYDGRCLDCDCNEVWGETRWWPCGITPPRVIVNTEVKAK